MRNRLYTRLKLRVSKGNEYSRNNLMRSRMSVVAECNELVSMKVRKEV